MYIGSSILLIVLKCDYKIFKFSNFLESKFSNIKINFSLLIPIFQLSIARLGSTVNFLVVGPLFAELAQNYVPHVAVGWTLLIAGSTCVMSFITAVVGIHFYVE